MRRTHRSSRYPIGKRHCIAKPWQKPSVAISTQTHPRTYLDTNMNAMSGCHVEHKKRSHATRCCKIAWLKQVGSIKYSAPTVPCICAKTYCECNRGSVDSNTQHLPFDTRCERAWCTGSLVGGSCWHLHASQWSTTQYYTQCFQTQCFLRGMYWSIHHHIYQVVGIWLLSKNKTPRNFANSLH